MRDYRFLLLLILSVFLSACNLTNQPPTDQPLEIPTSTGGKPSIAISKPQSGDEAVVGTQLFVSAKATDSIGVTRVQLLANGQIVKTVSSESPAGQKDFDVLMDYTPRAEGDVALQVVAYRGALASEPDEVAIKVRGTDSQVTATAATSGGSGIDNLPVIDSNDPTCRILTNAGLNLRSGPGISFDVLTVLGVGVQAPIIGRTGDNSWWQIRFGARVGWVSSQYTTEYGLCGTVPIIVPTVTPTSVIQATATPKPTLTPTATSTPGLPDLVIASISGPTDVAIPNGFNDVKQTYAVTITNTGSGPTRQFGNSITLPDNTVADLGTVANLNAGESITLNVDVTFAGAGTFLLKVQADSNSAVTEVSKVNNIGSLEVKVSK